MAAYAAVVSLMNTMDQIMNHPRLSTYFDKYQIGSIAEKLESLLNFVESYTSLGNEVEDSKRQIASAARAAEDVIESHLVDQIHAGENPTFCINLQKIIQDMSLVTEEVASVKVEMAYKEERAKYSTRAASYPSSSKSIVGFAYVLTELLDRLTGERDIPVREVIPIVGAGGVGKTTLARNAFERSFITHHFDVRAWANVSQKCGKREIFLQLLHSFLRISSENLVEFDDAELGVKVHKHLYNRRYLIILDDLWSIELWEEIQFFFPDNINGSRIVVTTRLSDLASMFGSFGLVVNLLTEYQSWDLFCETVFGDLSCPPELEEIGRLIVRSCKGLPLTITVIGGLLKKSVTTVEYWIHVAENISSILNSAEDNQWHDISAEDKLGSNLSTENNQLWNILLISYNAMPACLKPCFLYMGFFPEEHEFRVSRIIKLWVAEGFLKPNKNQTTEDVGQAHIKELIDRSLIIVSSCGSDGEPKTFRIHDLVRDLCMGLAKKEKFLCLLKTVGTGRKINSSQRFIVYDRTKHSQFFHALASTLSVRSLVGECPDLVPFRSRLLRVLIEVYNDSLDSTFQHVNLRFLAYESIRAPIDWIPTYQLPSSISLLWNLQTLIIGKKIEEVIAPSEIWEMPQLRHLDFYRICFPDPPASRVKDDLVPLRLQTLRTVLNFNCTYEVLKRMPNIKKLRILYSDFTGEGEESSWYSIRNVSRFTQLESLYCCFHKVPNHDDLVQNLKFPRTLRKLVLQDCELHWDNLSIIVGWLPFLEVLRLKSQSVRGPKWKPGTFFSLKSLEIDSCYLIYWDAEWFHFPVLEKLVLGRLRRLNEVPSGIGEIPTLAEICVVECSISAAISAVQTVEKQQSRGNTDIRVRVGFKNEREVAEFKAKVELKGLTTSALQIDAV